MTDPSFYSIKEVLAQMDARMALRLDRIESKLDAKADQRDLVDLQTRVAKLMANSLTEADASALRRIDFLSLVKKVDELDEKALTIDNVKDTITKVLRESEARGWTNRERAMGIILFGVTLASFVLNLMQSG